MSFVIDPQSRFLEMKSVQPYSTTDEYLYAMKEDLADWLSSMYSQWGLITADTFLECLENGALLCHHANNVNDAARKCASIQLEYCKFRSDARPTTFNARDNVSQFIRWARYSAGVREVLMFESDDLILRKNEKNFLLCLFEIARYGAKFGVSVPSLIQLEQEIDREIQRDKQIELIEPIIELHKSTQSVLISSNTTDSCSTLTTQENFSNHQSQTDCFDPMTVTLKQDQMNQTVTIDQLNQTDCFDPTTVALTQDQMNQTVTMDQLNQTFTTDPTMINDHVSNSIEASTHMENKPLEAPPSSSQLHKTVVQIVNSCCCAHRFPVVRLGEGKYRIGENGTIIFIRILRHHVMVRVGGGWDTLENYLNKHDPCRRAAHHNRHSSHHASDIPILAVPNHNVSSTVQKNTPFGKSVTIKTEEFPLNKPAQHDTDLADAQLVITRDADGRHRIGQITYKAEEMNHPTCPHHSISSPRIKTTMIRERKARVTPTSTYEKQSSPSTDQDYSSLAETSASKPSSTSSLDAKDEEEWIEQAITALTVSPRTEPMISENKMKISSINNVEEPTRKSPRNQPLLALVPSRITESMIEAPLPLTSNGNVNDFDIRDIDDAMRIDLSTMDNDSLDSSDGILDVKKVKPSTMNKTKPRVVIGKKTPETVRRPMPLSVSRYTSPKQQSNSISRRRSQSSEVLEPTIDTSKLDRDSGFDEQDFRRERLHSNGDDNSSVSSVRSARSSTNYKENKSYELRLKKMNLKRQSIEQIPTKDRLERSTIFASRDRLPSASRDRKLSQPTLKLLNTGKPNEHLPLTKSKIIS